LKKKGGKTNNYPARLAIENGLQIAKRCNLKREIC